MPIANGGGHSFIGDYLLFQSISFSYAVSAFGVLPPFFPIRKQ